MPISTCRAYCFESDMRKSNNGACHNGTKDGLGESVNETEAIRARFADPQPRMFPVAITFLVPQRFAR